MNQLKEISASAGLAIRCLALLAAAALMLACGPAAPPAPAGGGALLPLAPTDVPKTLPPAQQGGGDSAGKSGDAAPTEMPPPPPLPTIIYPNIRYSLNFDVMEFEAAQKSEIGPSGQIPEAKEDTVVLVRILLSGNKAEVAAWLRGKCITPLYADDVDYAHLAAEVPLSLLGELSLLDGVREIRRPYPTKPGS